MAHVIEHRFEDGRLKAVWSDDPVNGGTPSPEVWSDEYIQEFFERHTVLDTEPTHMVVTAAEPVDFRELGTVQPTDGISGASRTVWSRAVGEDYNPEWRGNRGIEKAMEMRRGDASVRTSLRIQKTPILAARWYVEPATRSARDKLIADFVQKNLTQWMSMSWPQLLLETMYMLDYGYYFFEKVFDVRFYRRQPRIVWRKFAPRHPLDVIKWNYDANGGPESVDMYNWPGLPGHVNIPISKLAVFTFDKEAGNLFGTSILRSAYKSWYYKETLYKIDAIQKERHGVGIPIIKLPVNFKPEDRALANQLGRNLRSNEKAHVVLPPMWEIEFAKLEGQNVDVLKSAEHHERIIFQNVLAEFARGDTTQGSQEVLEGLFMKSSRYIAEIIRDVFNKYCIPQLVDYNWPDVDEYPELRVRRLGDTTDWRTISFAARNLIGAQAMKPDDPLEDWFREEMDMPMRDPETTREPPTPQMPGAAGARVGQPRQAPAQGGMRQGQQSGAGNGGQDGSGGA